jgi:predicted SprT family Zn-dependent metalloprotease
MAATQTAFDFEASFAPEPAVLGGQGRPVLDCPTPPPPASKPRGARGGHRGRPRTATSPAPTKTSFDREANEQLEAALREALALPVRVTLTDNRRTMISLERSPRLMHVRLHHMFARADAPTLHALGQYLASADRDAAQQIGRFIEQHRTSIRGRSVRPVQLSAIGLHHNLNDIYRDVNAHYFANRVEAKISWSRDAQLRSHRQLRSIKLGSYTARDKLIRVHPALDAEFVPRFFVEYIVYHEMLHYVLPPRRTGKRRSLHGPEFQARERVFELFDEALCWERDNLERLLSRR